MAGHEDGLSIHAIGRKPCVALRNDDQFLQIDEAREN
jgi:hypothetical protein